MQIRTKRGARRRYNAIVRKLYKDHDGGCYGWDMPTLAICYPEIYSELRRLVSLYKTLPE